MFILYLLLGIIILSFIIVIIILLIKSLKSTVEFKIEIINNLKDELNLQTKKVEFSILNKSKNDIQLRNIGLAISKFKVNIIDSNKIINPNELLVENINFEDFKSIISINNLTIPNKIHAYLKTNTDKIYFSKSKSIKKIS